MLKITERENGSRRVQKVIVGESLTEQTHRPAANINSIVARARKGIMPELQTQGLTYGDFTDEVEFLEVQNRMALAKSEFMMLPSAVRMRFQNSPGRLCEFIANPENREEAIELGFDLPPIPVPPEPEEPAPADVADPE